MSEILGKWQQPEGQPFPGLWFEFLPDGSFRAEFEEMGITSSGIYQAENGLIDMDQKQHTFGILGKFQGRYAVDGEKLTMTLGDTNSARPESIEHKNKRTYLKIA